MAPGTMQRLAKCCASEHPSSATYQASVCILPAWLQAQKGVLFQSDSKTPGNYRAVGIDLRDHISICKETSGFVVSNGIQHISLSPMFGHRHVGSQPWNLLSSINPSEAATAQPPKREQCNKRLTAAASSQKLTHSKWLGSWKQCFRVRHSTYLYIMCIYIYIYVCMCMCVCVLCVCVAINK